MRNREEEMEEKEWLIGELYIANAKGDSDYAMDLSIHLYEAYGWSGTPYCTH